MNDENRQLDIWTLLEGSVTTTASSQSSANPAVDKDDPKAVAIRQRRWRRTRRILDLTSTVFWIYALLQVLGFDVPRRVLESVSPQYAHLADFRWILVAAVIFLAGVVWRWKTLGGILYLLGFPLIVVFWKIPKFFYRRRNWVLGMAFLNGIGIGIRNLRYNLITKSLGFVAAITILTTSNQTLLLPSVTYIGTLLVVAAVRTVRRVLEPNWFLKTQSDLIERIVDSKAVTNSTDIDKHLSAASPKTLTQVEASTLSNAISISIVINHVLYFWAYQLKQYKQAGLNVIFSLTAYAWLFLGAASVSA